MPAQSLEDFVREAGGESHLRVEHDFGDGFVRLRTSEAERRQAAQDIRCSEDTLIELLRNARDAHASNIFVALSRTGEKRVITVIDDGDGIPASMHEHIFESRVTSKLDTHHKDKWGMHGRGMALYSISVNSESAFVVESEPGLGTAMQVVSDTQKLPEKSDQSSFPTFILAEDGSVNVRGPRNLLRTGCEFAIEERSACTVHVGSPTEIAAAMYRFGIATLSSVDRLFCKDENALPIVKRLATASSPAELSRIAESIGLVISERSARRVMDGEIEAAANILDMVSIQAPDRKQAGKRTGRTSKRQKIGFGPEDLEELGNAAKTSYAALAERFYLEPGIEPTVRVSAEKITITLPIVRR